MKLNIPERGINLANHESGRALAQQVALWIMAQGIMPSIKEYQLCERLSAYALNMSDACWIRRQDYYTLMALDQPEHYMGRRINSNTHRQYIQEFTHWFREKYTQENPEFLFEILDV